MRWASSGRRSRLSGIRSSSGVWPTEGYEGYDFEDSKGMYDDDHFLELGLDEDNESELTDGRIEEWLTQVLQEAGIPDLADTGEAAAAS